MPAELALKVPADVERVLDRLLDAGYDAYVVGGAVRDALLGIDPHGTWDLTTNAKPEEIQKVFKHSLYNNRFGTVVVRSGDHDVEVTTYRTEAGYADHRRPDSVAFTPSLEEDLARRDFTINAMAWRPPRGGKPSLLVDRFGGRTDLEAHILRAVGDPDERFKEDALRMLRAVRFATLLDLRIDPATADAIRRNAALAGTLSGERIQQEIVKMLWAPRPSAAFEMLSDLGILAVICPELEDCKETPQDKAAADNVFQHLLATLDATVDTKRPRDTKSLRDLQLRLAGLFHDIGKPETFSDGHFHGHEHVGANIARTILRRWKFDTETVDAVTHLIRHHMFWYQSDWTDSAVRRFIRNVGLDNVRPLYDLRRADNIGSGARQPKMYALDALWLRIQEQIAAANAFSLRDLKIDGNDLKSDLGMAPGPEMGRVLNALFERVLDDPALNTRETLLALAKDELGRG